MGDIVTAKMDWREIEAMFEMAPKIAKQAAAAAMNQAASQARTKSKRIIAQTLRIEPQNLVAKRMRHRKAWKGSWPNMRTTISMIVKGIPLILLSGVKYDATRGTGTSGKIAGRRDMGMTGTGVSASGGRRFPHAFIAYGSKQLLHVFQRKTQKRHPIDVLRVETREVAERTMHQQMEIAAETVADKLGREIAWRLNKKANPEETPRA